MYYNNLSIKNGLFALWLLWPAAASAGLEKIEHIIVISLENRSFDNIFGMFPGADGVAQAKETAIQRDKNGKPYETLPRVMDSRHKNTVDTRFPGDIPNGPFLLDKYIGLDDFHGDLTHKFYVQQKQINGGRMDRFAALSNAGAMVMGYHDTSKTILWDYAKRFTLADRFFHAAFGGSFLNHFWMVCACSPRFENAPPDLRVRMDEYGELPGSGPVTDDGYVIAKLGSTHWPNTKSRDPSRRMPQQEFPTIGDRLSEKGIGWAWYADDWDKVAAGRMPSSFSYAHHPFPYFKNYTLGTDAAATHLRDTKDLMRGLESGMLPAVVFYKPSRRVDMHPRSSTVKLADEHIGKLLKAIEDSPVWKSTVVIVTYDENGGYWDHVPPPVIDRFGPGTRVPTLIISPFARKGYVDPTVYDTTSILALIETRFDLKPLGERDAKANNMLNALVLD